MNKERRKQLESIKDDLSDILADFESLKGRLDDAKSALESLRDEETEYRDNMPEPLQNSEKGERAEAAIGAMEDGDTNLDDAINKVDDLTSGIDEVTMSIDEAISNIDTAQE